MGEAALIALINQNYPDQFLGLITPAKERETLIEMIRALFGLADQADQTDFIYSETENYSIDNLVVYGNNWFRSLQNDNLGNIPPVVGSNSFWLALGSFSGTIQNYEPGVYLSNPALVIKDNDLFVLNRTLPEVGEEPFDSVNFDLELDNDIWVALTFNLPQSVRDALNGTMGTPSNLNRYVTAEGLAFEVDAINQYIDQLETSISIIEQTLADADLSTPLRVEYSDLQIHSPTSGTLNAKWYNADSEVRILTDFAVPFPGVPSAGTFRWDMGFGMADGSLLVDSEPESANPQKKTTPAGAVILFEVLWDETGNYQITIPDLSTVWSLVRYGTNIEPATNDKWAKIYDGPLSYVNNYQFQLAYAATGYGQQKVGTLNVGILCDENSNIRPQDLVLSAVDVNAAVGDFRLVQSGGRAILYHKSHLYWGRIRWRVVMHNEAVNLNWFVNGASYFTLSNVSTQWESQPFSGGGSVDLSNYYQKQFIDSLDSTGTEILFDRPRTYGTRSAPLTASTYTEINPLPEAERKGLVQKLFVQGTSFNPPNTWYKLDDGVNYDPAKVNLITVEYFSATNKTYNIMHYV